MDKEIGCLYVSSKQNFLTYGEQNIYPLRLGNSRFEESLSPLLSRNYNSVSVSNPYYIFEKRPFLVTFRSRIWVRVPRLYGFHSFISRYE